MLTRTGKRTRGNPVDISSHSEIAFPGELGSTGEVPSAKNSKNHVAARSMRRRFPEPVVWVLLKVDLLFGDFVFAAKRCLRRPFL